MKFFVSIILLLLSGLRQGSAQDDFHWYGGAHAGIALNLAPGLSKPNFKASRYNVGLVAAYFGMRKSMFDLYASLEYAPDYFAYQYTHPYSSNYSLSHSEVHHAFNFYSQVSMMFRLTGKSKIEMGGGTRITFDSKPKAKGQIIYKNEFDPLLQRHNNIPMIGVSDGGGWENPIGALFVAFAYHRSSAKYPWFVRLRISVPMGSRQYMFYAYDGQQCRVLVEKIILLYHRNMFDCTWGIQLWSSGSSKHVKQ